MVKIGKCHFPEKPGGESPGKFPGLLTRDFQMLSPFIPLSFLEFHEKFIDIIGRVLLSGVIYGYREIMIPDGEFPVGPCPDKCGKYPIKYPSPERENCDFGTSFSRFFLDVQAPRINGGKGLYKSGYGRKI